MEARQAHCSDICEASATRFNPTMSVHTDHSRVNTTSGERAQPEHFAIRENLDNPDRTIEVNERASHGSQVGESPRPTHE